MTDVRLAATTAMLGTTHTSGKKRYPFHVDSRERESMTDVRLAYPGHGSPAVHKIVSTGIGKNNMTDIRLAHIDGAQGDCILQGKKGVKKLPKELAPALLVSFFYLKPFLENQDQYVYRDWVLDSGAFSAFNSGATIDLDQYIETCLRLLKKDKTLTEVFALDVIGDHKASLKNTERMWEAGVPAIPTFHANEPEDYLLHIAKHYPKIALGGVALKREAAKLKWAEQCFARVWPKPIHGFAFASKTAVMHLPFHSVDATSWEIGPCGFGTWRSFGKMSVRGSQQNLRAEVEWYLGLERRATKRWEKQLKKLKYTPERVSVRLAVEAKSDRSSNLQRKPTIIKKKRRIKRGKS